MPRWFILFALLSTSAHAADRLEFGPPQAFSWEALIHKAKSAAAKPYVETPSADAEIAKTIDYPQKIKIHYRLDHTLFMSNPDSPYPVSFHALGLYHEKTVRMFALEGGEAREIFYNPGYFDMPEDSPARKLSHGAGFAGFEIKEAKNSREKWSTSQWVSFLGASYFRAVNDFDQWGMSARGIAVNTAMPYAEEFPGFTETYIESPKSAGDPVIVYALLEGPSLTGAYRFALRRDKNVVMHVETKLFIRKDIDRLGIAPLTSMFWYDQKNPVYDVRAEVHDSDNLVIWNGEGEHIVRPLNNAPVLMANSFADKNPKGFGLSQRDRNPENYGDGVRYENRPSVWVEPVGEWGDGAVTLIEIPTDEEIYDNIGAMWVPAKPAKAGDQLSFTYRLHWTSQEAVSAAGLAKIAATRIGAGGNPGTPRPKNRTKFVVEFEGGDLAKLREDENLTALTVKAWASRGKIENVLPEIVPGTKRWRVQFDLQMEDEKLDPVDLRVVLHSKDDVPLTEVWLYQFHPGRR